MPAASGSDTTGALEPLQLPIAEPFRTSQTFAVAKLALGLSNLVFAIVALGLMISVFIEKSILMLNWINDVYIILAVASIMWHVGGLITLGICRDWRSICPGAHVGTHLILWALAMLVVPLYGIAQGYTQYYSEVYEDCATDPNWPCNSYYAFPSQGAFDSHIGKMRALTAFSVMLLILHFILFVMACVETDRKGRHEKKTKVIYLVAAPDQTGSRLYYPPLAQPLQVIESTVLTTQPSHQDQEGIAANR